MKYFIEKALTDWAYKVNDGCPDPHNRTHIQILETVLRQYGCTEEFISEYLPRVQKLHEDDIVKNKDTGNVYTVKNHNPETQSLVKKDASPDDIKKVKKDVDSDVAETSPDIKKGFQNLPKRLDRLKAKVKATESTTASLAAFFTLSFVNKRGTFLTILSALLAICFTSLTAAFGFFIALRNATTAATPCVKSSANSPTTCALPVP